MLQINMADVMNVIGSLTPCLIAIGVLFVLALIITFAVRSSIPNLGWWRSSASSWPCP